MKSKTKPCPRCGHGMAKALIPGNPVQWEWVCRRCGHYENYQETPA